MRRLVPTSFTCGRPCSLAGTAYHVGDTVANSVVKALPHASRLIAGGFLIAHPEPLGRDVLVDHGRRQPTWLSQAETAAIS